MSLAEAPRPVRRAELGRAEWVTLHATADALEDTPAAARDFVAAADALLRRYPCELCARHLHSFCQPQLDALRRVSSRLQAVAWAARMHACVTEHLRPEDGAVVSGLSARLARAVRAAGADDAAVAAAVQDSLVLPSAS